MQTMSEFSAGSKVFLPKDAIYEDTMGLYPLPMFADIKNTGDRLQETVDQIGFPILASDLFLQKKKTIFDLKARTANSPKSPMYEAMSYRRSEYFNDIAENYGVMRRVGIGDSLGVPAIQGMQLHGETESTFDAILLRDGWNLEAAINKPTSTLRGLGRYALYQAKDALYSKKHPNRFVVPDHGFNKYESDDINETNPIQKLLNVADMMRGGENWVNTTKLMEFVALRGLALNVVCLRNGLSGSEKLQHVFLDSLDTSLGLHLLISGKTVRQAGILPFSSKIADGWHSDLLDPTRLANDINVTLGLLNN